ncbi:MAG TPA: dTMP kinase [Candidatus Limiplasma stercoravium]|nr:dTMP kinase [Candidatus Limiplasma stercoravium]
MNAFPYDAVAFDLDGTLFDAEEGIASSVCRAMESLGLPVPPEADLRELVGPPLRDSLRTLLKVPQEMVEPVMTAYHDVFRAEGMRRYAVYPHLRTVLRMLKDGGVHVGLATSKPRKMAEAILRLFALEDYFDRVAGEGMEEKQLGKAELIRRALPERYERAAMVGDRRFDMAGAREAGVDGIGAGWGCGTEEELVTAGATVVVPDTEALRALLCPGAQVPRGFFLSVEGPDGSGKTTQVDLLEKSLRQYGYSVLRTREPGGCPISEDIRRIILDTANADMCPECEALLYAASRAQHVAQVIRPAVERGMLVLCDRFVDSSVAYQGGGRGLGTEVVRQLNAPAVGDMMPDATLYLSIDHAAALRRRLRASEPDRLELEADDFHERVQHAYEKQIRDNRRRFLTVNADQSVDAVAHDALKAVLSRLLPQLKDKD